MIAENHNKPFSYQLETVSVYYYFFDSLMSCLTIYPDTLA